MRRKVGYIALLDVLGFERLVSSETYLDDLERYTSTTSTISEASDNSNLEFVLFSDTIVISTNDVSEESLKSLVRCCSRLFGQLLLEEIALRGAVAKGSFIRYESKPGVFLAGRAVVDAYKFEKQQDWVGILITPSVLKGMPDLPTLCRVAGRNLNSMEPSLEARRFDWMRCIQSCSRVPFHGGGSVGIYDGFAIVPTRSDERSREGIMAEIQQMQEALIRLKSLAPDPSAQKKYDRAQIWLGEVKGRWGNSPDF